MRTNRLLYFLDIFAITICNLIRLCSSELLDSVLFVGDSDVFFWGLQGQSSQTIPGSLNVGVPGYTCQSVLNRIDGFLSDYQPTLVILKCGTNDMWGSGQVSPEEAFERFTKVTDKIILSGATTIAMSTKPEPPVLEAGHPAMRWQKWNSLVEPYVLNRANETQEETVSLIYIESFVSLLELGNPSSFWSSDDIHMSAEGYSHWNAWVLTAIDEIDSRCVIWGGGSCSYFVNDTYVASEPICYPSSGQGSDPNANEEQCDPANNPDFAPNPNPNNPDFASASSIASKPFLFCVLMFICILLASLS